MEKLLIVLLLLSSSSLLVSSYNVSAIFTFGDSIFDAGNNHFNKNCSAQADFPPYGSSFFHYPTGRFTNGRTVADFISQFLGIGLQKPYLEAQIEVMNGSRKIYPSNGINFASAGSGVFQATNPDRGIISIQAQIQQLQEIVHQNQIDRNLIQNSIFLFESGSNDIFNYFLPFGSATLGPEAYVESMLAEVANYIDQIYKLGARRIVVFSLGPVGCVPARALLPDAPVDRFFEKMNLMVQKYNQGLESLIKNVPIKYPAAVGVFAAVYDIVQQFRALPSRYGLSDVTSACCGEGTLGGLVQCGKEGYKICSNPNAFLFWDYFHPTEHIYKLLAKAVWTGNNARIRPINLKTLATLS